MAFALTVEVEGLRPLSRALTGRSFGEDTLDAGSGGPWSPMFEELFEGAEMGFDDAANVVDVEGHVGPHPTEYHKAVLKQLQAATRPWIPHTAEYREAVVKALNALAEEIRAPGTRLNQLVTGALR